MPVTKGFLAGSLSLVLILPAWPGERASSAEVADPAPPPPLEPFAPDLPGPAYRPGVDVRLRPVAPADLPRVERWWPLGEVEIVIPARPPAGRFPLRLELEGRALTGED